MTAVPAAGTLGAIPYTTFPEISLGPLTLRTFGLMVALGIVLGALLAAKVNERWGVPSEDTQRIAIWMVVAGLIGARVAWVITNWRDLDGPLDVFAVWEGGLQFMGGFVGAMIVAVPTMRRWPTVLRWRFLDGAAIGLTLGMAIGRIGCYAVGEHLGGPTGFFLGVRYDGGDTREGPLVVGEVIHNTALYEFLWLLVLLPILLLLARRKDLMPSLISGIFLVWYGAWRFFTDFYRAYDRTVLGLTGAQWVSLVMVPAGIFILVTARRRVARIGYGPHGPHAVEEGEELLHHHDEGDATSGDTAPAERPSADEPADHLDEAPSEVEHDRHQ